MSLTSFLADNADVREYLKTAFPTPKLSGRLEMVVPPQTKNPTLVGSAFDYLARWMIRRANSGVDVIEPKSWVAENGVARLPDKKSQERGIEIVRKARATFKQFLKNGDLSDVVIDDLLVDLKVRKDAALKGPDFQALIGYDLLYEIGGIDGLYYLSRITRVGFYFARHRLLTSWTISELTSSPLEETLQWLRRQLKMDAPQMGRKTKAKHSPTS
jgi:hypothetical protein